MRRITLIDSVAMQRLGEDVARMFFGLVTDFDAAMRLEDLPLPPEQIEIGGGVILDFGINAAFILRTVPILPNKAEPKYWPRCHRIRFENIIKNGEVVV